MRKIFLPPTAGLKLKEEQVKSTQQSARKQKQSGKQKQRGSSLGILKTGLQTFFWLGLSLLVVEYIFAIGGVGEEEIFRFDKEIGTRHMTYKPVTWRKEGFARSYFDKDGMREPNLQIAKPQGVYRIALLGDSMVEGLQVPIGDTFGKLLEKDLQAENVKATALKAECQGKTIEVLNFGTSGYSTVQEYIQLDKQVFKYAPDMVIVGYNSRDMFENWAVPDAAIANVRPLALKLPDRPLVVESGSVSTWMRTPRAKLLMAIAPLRESSRIWGIFSNKEAEASQTNEFYKTALNLANQPAKTIRTLWQNVVATVKGDKTRVPVAQTTAVDIPASSTISTSQVTEIKPPAVPLAATSTSASSLTLATPKAVLSLKNKTKAKATEAQANANAKASGDNFLNLMSNTLEALYQGMDQKCRAHGARLVILGLPSRAALAPIEGMDATVYGLDYTGEIDTIKALCAKNNIAFVDALSPAKSRSKEAQEKLFYTAHLTREGHRYLTDVLLSKAELFGQK